MPMSLYLHKPTCQMTQLNACAHEACKYIDFDVGDGEHFRFVNNICVCSCGRAVRAKELRDWVISQKEWKEVQEISDSGLFLIYEENTDDKQGHVYIKENGINKGNGNYDWANAKIRRYFKKN